MLLAREAAEKLRDRLPGDLAEEIPERDVERRIAPDLRAGRAESDIAGQVLGDPVDGERIATEKLRSDQLVHIGFDGLRQEERLAQSDEPLVGVDAKPKQVGEFVEPDRFDGGDLHAAAPQLIPAASSTLTVLSKCSPIFASARRSVVIGDRRRDRLVAGDVVAPVGIGRARHPADPPGLPRHDVKRTDDQREHRIPATRRRSPRGRRCRAPSRARPDRSPCPSLSASRAISAASSSLRRSAASATVRSSTVRRTSRICCTRDLVGMDDMVEKQGERAGIHRRDARAATIADVDQAQRGHGAERFAHDRPGNAELQRKRVLARQRVSRTEAFRADVRMQRTHDVLDQARRRRLEARAAVPLLSYWLARPSR